MSSTVPTAGVARGALISLGARALTVLLGLGVMVLIARMGPTVQGAFSLFVAVESVLLTLFSGYGLAVARRVSHHGDAGSGPLRAWLRVALATGVMAALVLASIASWADQPPYDHLWLMAAAAPLLLLVPTASGLWLGQGRMLPLNVPQVAAPLLVLGGLAVLRAPPSHLAIALVLVVWVVAKSLVGVGAAVAAVRDARVAAAARPLAVQPGDGPARPLRAGWTLVREDLGFVTVIGLTNVVSLLNYRVTLFILERHDGLAAAGVYSVAVQLAELLWLVSSALTVSAYRRIGEPDREAAVRLTRQAASFSVAATATLAPLLWVGASYVLVPLLGGDYAPALGPLALLLPGVAAYAAASSLSAFFTNHLGRPHWAGAIAALSLALNTAGCLWAVPRHGAEGAAVSTSASYGIAIVVALLLFRREVRAGRAPAASAPMPLPERAATMGSSRPDPNRPT